MNLLSLQNMHQISQPKSLDQILHQDFEILKQEREEIDKIINDFTNEITDEKISSTLNYCNTKGESFAKNLAYIIQHLFNHQTHHRGQVSVLLSQAGIDIGATDLLMVMPNE
ncbi:MAG: damage-inducible protein DinB [Pseudomonadales bacterium]|nr:damage-inducible protein DinB [Pseudomonadales bacterium]